MLIDRNRRLVFVHVPKTGGQSIIRALGGSHDKLGASHEPLFALCPAIRKHFLTFGVVRNPFERLVSLYHFMCQKTMRPTDNFDQREVNEMGFKSWLMNGEFYMMDDRPFMNGGDQLLAPMQRRPQSWWLDGCDEYIVCDDDLEAGLNMLMRASGLVEISLPRINTSTHNDWREYYDDESREFVIKYHAEDFKQFGFSL